MFRIHNIRLKNKILVGVVVLLVVIASGTFLYVQWNDGIKIPFIDKQEDRKDISRSEKAIRDYIEVQKEINKTFVGKGEQVSQQENSLIENLFAAVIPSMNLAKNLSLADQKKNAEKH